MQRRAACDGDAVFVFFDVGPHAAEVAGGGGDAVGFFDAQFFGVADAGGAFGEGGGYGEDGYFVDEVGDFFRKDVGGDEACGCANGDVAVGFAFVFCGCLLPCGGGRR